MAFADMDDAVTLVHNRPSADTMRGTRSLRLPRLLLLVLAATLPVAVVAQTALQLTDCTSANDHLAPPQSRIAISSAFGQLDEARTELRLSLIASTPSNFSGFSNTTTRLATLFTTASVLTFDIYSHPSCFCATVRPSLPLPPSTKDTPCPEAADTFCPLNAGPFAFSVNVPLKHDYSLMSIETRLRILDVSEPALQLACVDVSATPLKPTRASPYGQARIIFWLTGALCLAFFVVIACARIASAWGRAQVRAGTTFWSRMQRTGFICVSALSGERFSVTPALLRFCTPAARDILFHTQWCASLAMVAVQWPDFAYPILSHTAWSMLLFNVTLTTGATHWNPLDDTDFVPPSGFAEQIADPSSPLFLDPAVSNTLLGFPSDTPEGIASLSAAVGLRPTDAFGTSVGLFLCVVAATIAASLLIWILDLIGSALFNGREDSSAAKYPGSHVRYSTPLALGHKDTFAYDMPDGLGVAHDDEPGVRNDRSVITGRRLCDWSRWWRKTRWGGQSSFHGAVLHGNLTRILILFHLPVTVFTTYQFSNGASSRTSTILAAVAFAVVSVIWPVFLLYRVARTSTSKLYEETRTLMAYGPAYNLFRQDSQLFAWVLFGSNLAFGITVGCGQRNGTAQSIIILVIEVAAALTTSLWLPWGQGAHMGLTSFLCCAARIISAVLLVILAPIVSVGSAAGGWVAYAILVIQGSVYAVFALMLLIKVIEGLVRLATGVAFEQQSGSGRHRARSGLFGALAAGCASRASGKSTKKDRVAQRTGRQRPKHPRTVSGTSGSSYELHDPSLAEQTALRPKGATPLQSSTIGRADHAESLASTMGRAPRYESIYDDDDGSIMGAWKNLPQFAESVPEPASPVLAPAPPAQTTGFARIGGGRTHFETPYAIAKNPPPSAFPKRTQAVVPVAAPMAATIVGGPAVPAIATSSSRPSTSGSGNTVRAGASTPPPSSPQQQQVPAPAYLPPGARPPTAPRQHVRTRSQTAVIEDASTFFTNSVASRRSSQERRDEQSSSAPLPNVPAIRVIDDDTTTDSDTAMPPPRRKWFGTRTNTASSSGPPAQPGDAEPDWGEDPAAPPGAGQEENKSKWTFRRSRKSEADLPSIVTDPPATEGRSFVVVRQGKSTPPLTPQEPSFKVIRPSRTPQQQESSSDPALEADPPAQA
ncbi:hypothetical protein EXIGLDRAFT_828063 [Exidia glandulosa HHB12029]|uniref:TRP C-terminal domain-containing protein n=1 Tax=Exidia glandulosa HHB12029 TaxID=1314781 RepID=A0A165QVV9_EXIGL|nr:hypothetical protein EXIGLDRAFT_828063 [Exidia glandulosa HHB12029]